MKKVFIKYNPYKLETEFTVDGKKLAQNSRIAERVFCSDPQKQDGDPRLQDWVEALPALLVEEYNDNDFDIVFHGTLLDYEDLTEVFAQAYRRGELTAKLDRIPAKETSDKEALIDEVFAEIQKGPFDALRADEIIDAFNKAKIDDFEICVVATMSAGKSTLINSMLGAKLMPSKAEACTAKITFIRDVKGSGTWKAKVYDENGILIETHENLTGSTMRRLNADEKVAVIRVEGDIPFVSSDNSRLVLVDTPGPNNARDEDHRKVQSKFLGKSSKALVLYIMESTFGNDDDDKVLSSISASMSTEGKQCKDRFIFVVNKMDNRSAEDGDMSQTLDRVRAYLEGKGIVNPNLFPAAALPALNIRLMQSGADMDEEAIDDTLTKIRKFNRNTNGGMHLETYATLPASIRADIDSRLSDKSDIQSAENALIHTGVVSIEAAIRQYVEKYAKTAKIKAIADSFRTHLLDKEKNVTLEQKLQTEAQTNGEIVAQMTDQIHAMQRKIDNLQSAKAFSTAVDEAVTGVSKSAKEIVDSIVRNYQAKIRQKIDALRGKELDMDDVADEVAQLEKYAKRLELAFQEELDELIRGSLIETSEALLDEYRKKLADLTSEIDPQKLSGITIDPLKLMSGSVAALKKISADGLEKTKEVEDGEEWVKNTDKKWYKPWTWFQESGYYRTKYKTVKYIRGNELAQKFLAPVTEMVITNGDEAYKHAMKEAEKITAKYKCEFERLDAALKEMLSTLERNIANREGAEERIKELNQQLAWLKHITGKVESILEI